MGFMVSGFQDSLFHWGRKAGRTCNKEGDSMFWGDGRLAAYVCTEYYRHFKLVTKNKTYPHRPHLVLFEATTNRSFAMA